MVVLVPFRSVCSTLTTDPDGLADSAGPSVNATISTSGTIKLP